MTSDNLQVRRTCFDGVDVNSDDVRIVPAGCGAAVVVPANKHIRLINTSGTQVIDVWAFSTTTPTEHMSMSHSHATMHTIFPRVGNTLVTNHSSPILTITKDTTPGNHDTLVSACDLDRYQKVYGVEGWHANCAHNMKTALADIGFQGTVVDCPAPFNAFMNIPVGEKGVLTWEGPNTKVDDYIEWRAEMECVIVFSSCPNDMTAINGMVSRDASFLVW